MRCIVMAMVLCATPAWAQSADQQCEPATKGELRSAGGYPAKPFEKTSGGYSKEFFCRVESPKRTACQLSESKMVKRVLAHRKDVCNAGQLLQDSFKRLMQLNQGIEFEDIGGGYFFNEGCMAHSCGEKAFTLMDAAGTHGAVGILECTLNDAHIAPAKPKYWQRVVDLYSDFGDLDKFPQVARTRIQAWTKEQEAAERQSFPNATVSIVHLK